MCIILRKLLLTTQQTTYRFGALGNSGDKSAEERGFPSGKGRKKLFLAEIALIGSFGTIRPQVRTLSLGPYRVFARNFPYEHSLLIFIPLASPLQSGSICCIIALRQNESKTHKTAALSLRDGKGEYECSER